jgi:hypothetical protein
MRSLAETISQNTRGDAYSIGSDLTERHSTAVTTKAPARRYKITVHFSIQDHRSALLDGNRGQLRDTT